MVASSSITRSPTLKSSTPQYANRCDAGASLSKVITATPRETASSIARDTFSSSEHEIRIASTWSFTAWRIRCA